jgi:hypothetical protein
MWRLVAHPAVEHQHEVAPIVETAIEELGQALGRGREKAPADRGVAHPERLLLDGSPDRFETCPIAAGRETGEHASYDAVGEQVSGARGLIARERELRLAVGTPNARPSDRQTPATESDRTCLAAMAIGRPIGAVLALWTRQSVDLAPHQLLEDFEADRGRGGEKALAHVRREGGQMSSQAIGQLDRQRMDQLRRSAANS